MEYKWNSLDYISSKISGAKECRESREDQGPKNEGPGSGSIVRKVDFKRRHLPKYMCDFHFRLIFERVECDYNVFLHITQT